MSGHLDLDSLYTLGKSVTKDIPGIAYTIPDLDARVRVIVYDTKTYEQLACVETTLSNGKLFKQNMQHGLLLLFPG